MSAWETAWTSLLQVWNNKRAFIKIFAPWFAVQIAVMMLQVFYLQSIVGDALIHSTTGIGHTTEAELQAALASNAAMTENMSTIFFVSAISAGLSLLTTIIPAIGWHRFLLLREFDDQFLIWKPGFNFLGYFGATFRLGVMFGTGLLLCGLLPYLLFGTAGLLLVFPLGIFLALPLFARLQITLASIALNKPQTYREAFDATKDRYWFFFGIPFCVAAIAILIIIPFGILSGIADAIGLNVLSIGVDVLGFIPQMIFAAMAVGVISNLYHRFVIEADQPRGE